jgi:exodeoxyribonuclease VII small subunit
MAKPKFEKTFKELQEITAALEQGDLPLDECLAKYEAAVKALRVCRQLLDEAEKKIEMLTKDEQGRFKTKPFEPEAEPKNE